MRLPRRLAGALLAAGATVAVSGCTAPLPQVSFYGNATAVVTAPAMWCAPNSDATGVDCAVDRGDADAPQLALHAGQAVSVNVPDTVGSTPWVVLMKYRAADGSIQEVRGPLLTSGIQQRYVLRPPSDTDQLLRIEVQSGLTPVAPESGSGVDYAAMHTWVLLIDPVA